MRFQGMLPLGIFLGHCAIFLRFRVNHYIDKDVITLYVFENNTQLNNDNIQFTAEDL